MSTLLDAQRRVRKVERSPRFEAEAALEWLASATDLDADTLTRGAQAAEAGLDAGLDESNQALADTRVALQIARERHEALEAAASEVG